MTRARHRLRIDAVILTATIFGMFFATSAAEAPVVFRFDPGDDRSWIETTRVSVTSWPRQEGDRPFEDERVDRLTARRAGERWELSVERVSQHPNDRPRPVLDPIVSAFGGRIRSVSVDGAGRFTGFRLADEPATETARVRDIAGAEAVDRVLADAWRRLRGGLAGRKGAHGAIWTERLKVPLASGGSPTYKTTWSVDESVSCDAGRCVRVGVLWSAELTPLFMAMQNDVASRWGGAMVNPSGLQRWYLKGKGQLVVDPDGVRVFRLRIEQKLSVETAMTRESPLIREVVETRETVASPDEGPR